MLWDFRVPGTDTLIPGIPGFPESFKKIIDFLHVKNLAKRNQAPNKSTGESNAPSKQKPAKLPLEQQLKSATQEICEANVTVNRIQFHHCLRSIHMVIVPSLLDFRFIDMRLTADNSMT